MADSYRNRPAENTSVIHIRACRISGDISPSLASPSNDLGDKRNVYRAEDASWNPEAFLVDW
jgi:hypothetical protein